MRVYLDHNATSPVHGRVLAAAPHWLKVWGNASSIHWAGRDSKNVIRETRQNLAAALGCQPLELVFNSGGSEGNSTVIRGVFEHFAGTKKNHYLCSRVEHPSVMKTYEHLQSLGARVDYVPVSREGILDLEFLREHLSTDTALVSLMMANNESGHIFPVREVTRLAAEVGALVHSDCVQALGKIPLNLAELGVNFATFSAHKFYSVKGTGFVYIKRGSPFLPLIRGGAQERQRRGGTENIFGIACLKEMIPCLAEVSERSQAMAQLRDGMEAEILRRISGAHVTGAMGPRLSNTSSLVIDGTDGETLLMSLDLKGFAVSTGAACSSGNPEPSPVLLAMGLTRAEAQTSLRLSLGWENTPAEIEQFVSALVQTVDRLRALKVKREAAHV